MVTFTNFANILPDPTNKIGPAGEVDLSTGAAGPGFNKVKLGSIESMLHSKTNSQRRHSASGSHHMWEINISYNKLLCDVFDPLFSFLLKNQISLEPFYVSLPQYASQTTTTKTAVATTNRGSTTLLLQDSASNPIAPQSGFIFSVSVSDHTKLYMVTRVETSTDFFIESAAPGAGEERVHITPALQKDIPAATGISFTDPQFFVIQSNNELEYSIDLNNLYSFSLDLEEVDI